MAEKVVRNGNGGLAKKVSTIVGVMTVLAMFLAALGWAWHASEVAAIVKRDIQDRATKLEVKQVEVDVKSCWDFALRMYEEGTKWSKERVSNNSMQNALVQAQIETMSKQLLELKTDVKCLDTKLDKRQTELLTEIRSLKDGD